MTAIAAMKTDTGVVMGGDSAGVAGYSKHTRLDPKVFWCGQLLIGYTTSFRMAQLIRFGLHDAHHVRDLVPPDNNGLEFMVTDFVPRVRYLFEQGGFLRDDSGRESGGTFMVAWQRNLFTVMDDLQVAELADPFNAVGCGDELCIGAMDALQGIADARECVHRALETAERWCAGVSGPFVIHSTDNSK